MRKIYVVKEGRTKGLLYSWEECEESVKGFKGAIYKSFSNESDALNYLNNDINNNSDLKDMQEIDYSVPYAFVDGSFNPKDNIYGCGGYLVYKNNKYEILASDDDEEMISMRNISGELLGTMLAIDKAIELGIKELVIYYDYIGIEYWANGDWKRNKKGTIEYYNYIQSIKNQISLKFVHVKGHSGVLGNEDADKLAKKAVGIIV